MDKKIKQIIYGIKQKDKSYLILLMNEYGKLVYCIANKILNEGYEKEYIDECYNDVFTTIWFNIDCFDEEKGNFKSWLISVTKYKAIDIKRKIFKSMSSVEYLDELTSSDDNNLEQIENIELIYKALEILDDKDRKLFLKRYLEDMSVREIAIELGYSEDYIYTRISRGKKKIKREGGEDYEG